MHRTLRTLAIAAFAFLLAAILSAPAAAQQDVPVEQLPVVPRTDLIDDVQDVGNQNDQYEVELLSEAHEEEEEEDGLWIGVKCTEVAEPLAVQLNLADKRGILIDEVLPDSPASKAGIEKFDVIISADDHKLAAPEDLVKVVESAGDKNIRVLILRKGEKKEVELKPGKRPLEFKPRWKFEERVLRAVRPGVVLRQDAADSFQILPDRMFLWHHRVEIPDDMTIITTRKGKEPARYEVKRGDESWEATDETLDKLPKEARAAIEGMRGPIRLPLPGDRVRWEFIENDSRLTQLREALDRTREHLKMAQGAAKDESAASIQRLKGQIASLEATIAERSAQLAADAAKVAQDHEFTIKVRVQEEIERAMAVKEKAIEAAKGRVKEELDAAMAAREKDLNEARLQLEFQKEKLIEKAKAARDQIDTEAIGKMVEQQLEKRLDQLEQRLESILEKVDRLTSDEDDGEAKDADEKPKEEKKPDGDKSDSGAGDAG